MRSRFVAAALLSVAFVTVCPASEKAVVQVRYLLGPSRGIPEGVRAVAILDAGVNDEHSTLATDTEWSALAANYVQHLLQEATQKHGISLDIVDRRHTATVLKEADLAAAGLVPSATAGQAAKLLEVQGIIMAEINVKIETTRQTKNSGGLGEILDKIKNGKRRYRGGRRPGSRRVILRKHVTVQTVLHLFDAKTSKNWATYAKWHRHSEKSKISDFFTGVMSKSSDTERDEIIEQAVQRGAREFVRMLVPSVSAYEVEVKSSGQDICEEGVRSLRAEMYEQAVTEFSTALSQESDDDRAAFGAGVACEALGRYEDALKYFRMAYRLDDDEDYKQAIDRVKTNTNGIE